MKVWTSRDRCCMSVTEQHSHIWHLPTHLPAGVTNLMHLQVDSHLGHLTQRVFHLAVVVSSVESDPLAERCVSQEPYFCPYLVSVGLWKVPAIAQKKCEGVWALFPLFSCPPLASFRTSFTGGRRRG